VNTYQKMKPHYREIKTLSRDLIIRATDTNFFRQAKINQRNNHQINQQFFLYHNTKLGVVPRQINQQSNQRATN